MSALVKSKGFERFDTGIPEDAPEVAADGKWITSCPECGHNPGWWHHPCQTCEGDGKIVMEPQEPMGACDWKDHRWKIRLEEGRARIVCIDPHTIEEREAMIRDENGEYTHVYPVCDPHNLSDYHDCVNGAFEVDLEYVFEPGTYEYPDETSYWIDVEPKYLPPEEISAIVEQAAFKHIKVEVELTNEVMRSGYITGVLPEGIKLNDAPVVYVYHEIKEIRYAFQTS